MTTSTSSAFVTSSTSKNMIYTSTKSPRELMLIIMQTLDPDYHMTAAQAQELYKKLKSNIVPSPPSSLRTGASKSRRKGKEIQRKDYTTCQLGRANSHYCAPEAVNQSFYLHHTMPLFSKLFPHIDLSTYERAKKATSEQSMGEDSTVCSKQASPEFQHATSPCLSSSSSECSPLTEDLVGIIPHFDVSGSIEAENLLPGETTELVEVMYPMPEHLETVTNDGGVNYASIYSVKDVKIDYAHVAATIDKTVTKLDEESLTPTTTLDDSLFSQTNYSTQDSSTSQLTLTSLRDPGQDQYPQSSTQSQPDSTERRRSARLAKSNGTSKGSTRHVSTNLSTLGKRSRNAVTAADEQGRKRSKS